MDYHLWQLLSSDGTPVQLPGDASMVRFIFAPTKKGRNHHYIDVELFVREDGKVVIRASDAIDIESVASNTVHIKLRPR